MARKLRKDKRRAAMHTLLQDLRYALRQMRRSLGFTIIAVLTLTLGVGAAAAIYSVVDAVILEPLPYQHPDRIYTPTTIAKEGYFQPPSWPGYKDMRAQNHSFSALAGYTDYTGTNLQTKSGPVALNLIASTANFFKVFGVQPILGRTYRPDEDQPGKNNVAVLSYEVWKANFNGDPNVVGSKIDLDGKPYTCIGVMPAGFMLLSDRHAIYAPIVVPQNEKTARGNHWLMTIGLLKPGVTMAQAQADMNHVMANLDSDAGRKVEMISIAKETYGDDVGSLWTLAGAVLAVLLIACVNLAGLLLARGVKREREMALRTAIGASRKRVVRQVLTENLVLACFGAVGGICVAWLLLAAMRSFLVTAVARGANAHLEWKVLLAAMVLASLTSLLASLAPALRLSGTDPNRALKTGGSAGSSGAQHRLRSSFIITQMALSLVLLAVAGVLFRSIAGYRNENLGFNPHHLLTAQINLAPARYGNRNVWTDFYQPLLERVRHIHGVEGAGLISTVPILEGSGTNEEIHISGQPPYPPQENSLAEIRFVSPGYFQAMGLPLIRGRMLSPEIDLASNKASTIVVNQAFVKKYIPSSLDPVGQHLDDADQADQKTRIVGVVASARQDLISRGALPEMDMLYTELPTKDIDTYLMSTRLMVRTSGSPKAIIPDLRRILHSLDPTIPFRQPMTMEQAISSRLVMQRLEGWLFGIFASLAVLLAIIGLYGLISHEVELRTRDIGVRMALGATRASVLAMVLRRVTILMAIGVALGLTLTAAAQKLIGSVVQIHFIHQAGLMLALAMGLTAAGLLAAFIPARRAAAVEPMQALRSE
jgi:putative ABC transport system permease protein